MIDDEELMAALGMPSDFVSYVLAFFVIVTDKFENVDGALPMHADA